MKKLRAVPSYGNKTYSGNRSRPERHQNSSLKGVQVNRELGSNLLALKPGSNGFTAKAFVRTCEIKVSVGRSAHHGEHRRAEESNFAFLAGETG